ncbi:MAG TPA: hypothetical protein VLB67_00390 [Acidimicrobiia bacterium]|nr:hypothetical protein [Acidimicrobiia bacterium]
MTSTTTTRSATTLTPSAVATAPTVDTFERAMAALRAAGIGFDVLDDSHCPPRAA